MMGLEPTTFCMASRRSSQLSYIRASAIIAATNGRAARRVAAPMPEGAVRISQETAGAAHASR